MHPSDKPSSGVFFPTLEGMRAIAVLSVVIFHTAYFNPESKIQNFLFSFTKAGWMGVPIFFVLSGFLISYAVFKAPETFNLPAYVLRRFAKIAPPYIISLIMFSCLSYFWLKSEHILASVIAHVTTFAHFSEGWAYLNPVYWSLFVEIHFYIALPLIYFFCRRCFKHPEWATFIIFLILPAVIRLTSHLPESTDKNTWIFHANLFPRALDNFALGIFFTIIYLKRSLFHSMCRCAEVLTIIGLLLLATTYCIHAFELIPAGITIHFETFRYLPALATFLMLFSVFLSPSHFLFKLLSWRPLAFIGIISYEWFLFHYPPVQFIGALLGQASGNLSIYLLKTAVPFIGTFLISVSVYFFISQPILLWAKSKIAEHNSLK